MSEKIEKLPAAAENKSVVEPGGKEPVAAKPRVVIVGAGFGGLQAALALGKAPVEVTVIDRNNHHLFQPLLYWVATAGLSPADISSPIRHILRKQKNTEVLNLLPDWLSQPLYSPLPVGVDLFHVYTRSVADYF